MSSLINNSYVFGLSSAYLVQELFKLENNKIPVGLSLTGGLLTSKCLHFFHQKSKELASCLKISPSQIDQVIAKAAVPVACIALTAEHLTNPESSWQFLALKSAALIGLNPFFIEPGIKKLAPVERGVDFLSNAWEKTGASSLVSSLQTTVSSHILVQAVDLIAKISITKLATETLAKNINYWVPKEEDQLGASRAVTALALAFFITTDFLSPKNLNK